MAAHAPDLAGRRGDRQRRAAGRRAALGRVQPGRNPNAGTLPPAVARAGPQGGLSGVAADDPRGPHGSPAWTVSCRIASMPRWSRFQPLMTASRACPCSMSPFGSPSPKYRKNRQRRHHERARPAGTERLLLLTEGHCLRDQALAICGTTDRDAEGDFRATSLETIRQMVATGMGSTLLPAMACSDFSEVLGSAARPLETRNRTAHRARLAPKVPSRRRSANAWRKR